MENKRGIDMFKKFLGWIRQVFSKLISRETVEEKRILEGIE